MIIITQDNCPRCEEAKKKYPNSEIVRVEELLDGSSKHIEKVDLRVVVELSDGNMPILVNDLFQVVEE